MGWLGCWRVARSFPQVIHKPFPVTASSKEELSQPLQDRVFHDGTGKLLRISVVNNLVKSRE